MASRMGRKPNQLLSNVLSGIEYLAPPHDASPEFVDLWSDTVKDFPPDHFKPSHREQLRCYVNAALKVREIEKTLDREGYTIQTEYGEKVHPLIAVAAQAENSMQRWARLLKLSLSSQLQTTQSKPQAPKASVSPISSGRRPRIAGVSIDEG